MSTVVRLLGSSSARSRFGMLRATTPLRETTHGSPLTPARDLSSRVAPPRPVPAALCAAWRCPA